VLLIFSVSSCTRVCVVCTGTWAARLTSTVQRLGDPKCRVSSIALVHKVCSADRKGSATNFQGSVDTFLYVATVKFTYFSIQVIMFC
jgi:hypothetical protein